MIINMFFSFLYGLLLVLFPLAFAVLLGYIAWKLWVHYVYQSFIAGIDWVLLEIVPPRDVLRSPKAMELFFTNSIYQITKKSLYEKYWAGAVPFYFSLEVVSLGGQVHFYIRTPSRLKELIETQMYSQYPQAQVKIAEDYTLAVDKITTKSAWNLWGCEFALEKPDPYPIKTYVDFGLDKDPKEEYKVDPVSPVIELFGSIQKTEQMWVQIVLTPSQPIHHEENAHNTASKEGWVHDAELEIERIALPYTKFEERADGTILKSGRTPDFLKIPLEGITKKMTKLGFDCGIRACYVAKKEDFKDNSRRNLRLIFRQYANPFLNSFSRINSTQFQYPWQFTKITLLKLKNRMLEEYRERAFFYMPLRHKIRIPWPVSLFLPKYFHHQIFVLNTEELATIWHFPGQILKVPTLERIESKEASPPTNLPM